MKNTKTQGQFKAIISDLTDFDRKTLLKTFTALKFYINETEKETGVKIEILSDLPTGDIWTQLHEMEQIIIKNK